MGERVEDCLFCRVIAGAEPGNVVYRDGAVVAFTALEPKARIHLILASRAHIRSVDALRPEDTGLCMHLLQVARLLAREHGIDVEREGYHLGTNAGRDNEREFPHLHVWLTSGARD